MTDNQEQARSPFEGWAPWHGNVPTGPEDTYWHYTNAAGLLGILQSHELWATSPVALNDTAEIEYGRALVEFELNEASRRYTPADFRKLKMMVSPYLSRWGNGNVFVISTSADGDLLNQWHHYADTGGFAIGLRADSSFSARRISQAEVHEPDPSDRFPVGVDGWVEVEYDPDRQGALVRSFFDYFLQAPSLEEHARISRLMISWAHLYTLMCRLKDPRFSAEREVRYLASTSQGHHMEDFRLLSGRIAPYIHLKRVDSRHGIVERLPITEIRIGPGNPQETQLIVRRAASTNGYGDVSISRSNAPLR